MLTVLVKLVAKPGTVDELVEFLRWDAEVCAKEEPGTLRFDVYEVPDEPGAFYLYEAYADPDAFKAHQAGAPFQHFEHHIIPNVIEPLELVLRGVAPIATNHR